VPFVAMFFSLSFYDGEGWPDPWAPIG
jgi:hypothetical protein